MIENTAPNGTFDALGKSLLHHLATDQLNVLLVRHGQPGPGPTADGLLGNPLTALGRRQARRLAKRLAPVTLTHIYSSDMARSHETAAVVNEFCPDTPWDVLTDLREVGSFHRPDYPPAHTAEQQQQLHEQRQAAERFIERLRTRHGPGEVVAVIAHGAINRLLLATMAGQPVIGQTIVMTDAHHASVTVASMAADGYVRLKLLNCIRHLPPSMIGSVNL